MCACATLGDGSAKVIHYIISITCFLLKAHVVHLAMLPILHWIEFPVHFDCAGVFKTFNFFLGEMLSVNYSISHFMWHLIEITSFLVFSWMQEASHCIYSCSFVAHDNSASKELGCPETLKPYPQEAFSCQEKIYNALLNQVSRIEGWVSYNSSIGIGIWYVNQLLLFSFQRQVYRNLPTDSIYR